MRPPYALPRGKAGDQHRPLNPTQLPPGKPSRQPECWLSFLELQLALRAVGRLKSGGGGFNPSALWAGGGKGLWLDPVSSHTVFQDSAGTTAGVVDQPIGKRLDRSGNNIHFLQGTSGSRPLWKLDGSIYSDLLDGTDDAYATSAFATSTLSADMTLLVCLKRNTTNAMVLMSQSAAGRYIGTMQSGVATVCASNVGAAWTCWVDNVQVGGTANTTFNELHTAVGSGSYKLIEFRNLDMTTWTALAMGLYTSFILSANVAQVMLFDTNSDLLSRARTYAAAKGGLTL